MTAWGRGHRKGTGTKAGRGPSQLGPCTEVVMGAHRCRVWLRGWYDLPIPPHPRPCKSQHLSSIRGRVPDDRTHWGLLLLLLLVPFPCPRIQAELNVNLLSQLKSLSNVPSGWWASTQIVAGTTEEWISNLAIWSERINKATHAHGQCIGSCT